VSELTDSAWECMRTNEPARALAAEAETGSERTFATTCVSKWASKVFGRVSVHYRHKVTDGVLRAQAQTGHRERV